MTNAGRPIGFWVITVFLAVSIPLMLVGQTMAVFDYDLASRLGLQESEEQVGPYGVQVNRAFGVGDSVVYIPLMVLSLAGLLLKKRWSLISLAAVAGISIYWSVTVGFILLFLPGTSGYSYVPGPGIWLFVVAYAVFGVWSLLYLLLRGDALIR